MTAETLPDTAPGPDAPETAPTSTDATAAPSYLTQSWHALTLYLCPACGYDTLQLARIEAHLQTCQAFARMQAPVSVAPEADAPISPATPDTGATPPREEA